MPASRSDTPPHRPAPDVTHDPQHPADVERQARSAQVGLVFDRARTSSLRAPVAGKRVCWLPWNAVDQRLLAGWGSPSPRWLAMLRLRFRMDELASQRQQARDRQMLLNLAGNATVTEALLPLRTGLAVDPVIDGAPAVTQAASTHHDLILMDCQMPDIEGFEATAPIRTAERPSGRARQRRKCGIHRRTQRQRAAERPPAQHRRGHERPPRQAVSGTGTPHAAAALPAPGVVLMLVANWPENEDLSKVHPASEPRRAKGVPWPMTI